MIFFFKVWMHWLPLPRKPSQELCFVALSQEYTRINLLKSDCHHHLNSTQCFYLVSVNLNTHVLAHFVLQNTETWVICEKQA